MAKIYPAETSSVASITEYVCASLSVKKVNSKLLQEYRLLIEELSTRLISNASEGSSINVQLFSWLGKFKVRFSGSGPMVKLSPSDENDLSGIILEEYSDYLSQSYSAGINIITFSTSANSNYFAAHCVIALILSILTAIILRLFVPAQLLEQLKSQSVFHALVSIFTKCMSMLAIPVTFFSMATSLIQLILSREHSFQLTPLISSYIIFSLLALITGILFAELFGAIAPWFNMSAYIADRDTLLGNDLSQFVSYAVASDIISPFTSDNPLPILILAVLVAHASVSVFGTDGEGIRQGIFGIKSLFCRMLDIIYSTMPFFMYFAMLNGLVNDGIMYIYRLGYLCLAITIPLTVFCCLHAIRLRLHGITFKQLRRDYGEIIIENFKIGSNIYALPYNRRWLRRKTSISRSYLDTGLRLGTVLNMDGSSLLIAFCTVFFIKVCGIELSRYEILSTMAAILLLSIGAPNQPGSLLMVMVVLLKYVGISSNIIADILIVEAVFGRVYSFINSLGDIFSIIIEDKKSVSPVPSSET